MGGAIAVGMAGGSFIGAGDITCVDSNPQALAKLRATDLPFVLTRDLKKAIQGADILILAVKGPAVAEVIAAGRDYVDFNRQILFSAVADVTFADMDEMFFAGREDNKKRIDFVHFRVMPNISIAINESMTFISSRSANAAQIKLAETIFGEMGQTMVVPENMLGPAMAVSSCGIAFVMRGVRAAMNGTIEAGFSAEDAHSIVLQTMKGAVRLLVENNQHPEVEIDRVITPGGFTIRGLNAMEEHGFSNSIIAGIRESYRFRNDL